VNNFVKKFKLTGKCWETGLGADKFVTLKDLLGLS